MNLSDNERRYIEAALLDEHHEFTIDPDEEYVLFQDVEGDDVFLPSVTILHAVNEEDVEHERERIDELLEQFDWFTYEHLNVEVTRSGQNVAHAYPEGVTLDENVVEDVATNLDAVDEPSIDAR